MDRHGPRSLVAFVLGALIGGRGRLGGFWWGPFIVAALIWLCSQYLFGVNAAKLEASQPATISLADKKAAAISAAKALPDSGPLSAAQCQTALAGLIAGENIKFETGSAKVSSESGKLISAIGAILSVARRRWPSKWPDLRTRSATRPQTSPCRNIAQKRSSIC